MVPQDSSFVASHSRIIRVPALLRSAGKFVALNPQKFIFTEYFFFQQNRFTFAADFNLNKLN
ncbi:MAG: hypothetical protein DWQ02_24100 [Bacteroidetes bacterium]|nr:MAG: hypothetical protein DWQ02_24100 [Bacteroidota bacterium]